MSDQKVDPVAPVLKVQWWWFAVISVVSMFVTFAAWSDGRPEAIGSVSLVLVLLGGMLTVRYIIADGQVDHLEMKWRRAIGAAAGCVLAVVIASEMLSSVPMFFTDLTPEQKTTQALGFGWLLTALCLAIITGWSIARKWVLPLFVTTSEAQASTEGGLPDAVPHTGRPQQPFGELKTAWALRDQFIIGSVDVTEKGVVTHRDSYLFPLSVVSVRRPFLIPAGLFGGAALLSILTFSDLLFGSEQLFLAIVGSVLVFAAWQVGQLSLLSLTLKGSDMTGAVYGAYTALNNVRGEIATQMEAFEEKRSKGGDGQQL